MSLSRILYVEDNDDLREAVALLLESDGREIVSCATGEEAQQLFRSGGCDVLVTDVTLPGMSGTELAQALLADRPGLPVVICSGYGAALPASALGPNVRWITKPFEVEQLERLLDELPLAGRPA